MASLVDDAVVGSGPVALTYALFAARTRTVALAARPTPPARSIGVESVPAPLLTLLLELGIHPAELDVEELHRSRWIAWTEPTVTEHPTRAGAHIERGALLGALWRRIEMCPSVDVIAPGTASRGHSTATIAADPIRAGQLVDARGRPAATGNRDLRPPQPWLATSCTLARAAIHGGLRLAAAPSGYGYRLGSARHLTIGWVAPGRPPRTTEELRAALSGPDTRWLIDGVNLSGPLSTRVASLAVRRSSASSAGTEVNIEPFISRAEPITIGDAALRRDALASQGLSIGLSDARLTARSDWTAAASANRTQDSTRRHIHSLLEMLAIGRHRDCPTWRAYADWIRSLPLEGA